MHGQIYYNNKMPVVSYIIHNHLYIYSHFNFHFEA